MFITIFNVVERSLKSWYLELTRSNWWLKLSEQWMNAISHVIPYTFFFFLKTEWPINMTRCNTTSTASVYADLRRFFLVLCQHINCFQYHSYSLISILFNNKILCMNSVISHKAFYDLFFQITFLLLNHIFLKVLIWRVVVVIFPIVFVWKYISN